MKQILFDRPQSILGCQNIAKILLVHELLANFNPSQASLNLYKFIEIVIKFLKL
jgi:hypothetical protein